jgi:UDP-2,3-diacylglucosamine hydrolase
MTTYFISDLHLSPKRPSTSEQFLRFLEHEAREADAIYILGDFFEVWVGDDNDNAHDIHIREALAVFNQTGIPVYFMHGNRDFLIGEQFFEQSGCILLNDPSPIDLYGNKVLLTHGDLLCTFDRAYQRFRKFVHNPFIQKWFLKFPLSIRQKIASFLRNISSRQQHPSHYQRAWDVSLDAVYSALRQNNCYTMIHGHTHQPKIHEFILDNQEAKRIVLGEWGESSTILAYGSDSIQLKSLS